MLRGKLIGRGVDQRIACLHGLRVAHYTIQLVVAEPYIGQAGLQYELIGRR